MLDKIEVGNTYLDVEEDEVTVIFVGEQKLFYSWKNNKGEYFECSKTLDNARKYWKELPKEPKKLGQLYVCVEPGSYSTIGDLMVFPVGINAPENWQPCTLNVKTGEVFSVE